MKIKIIVALLLAVQVLSVKGQSIEIRTGHTRDIAKYFEGTWKGEGKFANGKAIAAIATFKPSLDSCWLVYDHQDQLPNSYHALSLWGTDKSKNDFPAVIFDNSRSKRDFCGTHLKDNEVILLYKNDKTTVIYYERFTYFIQDHSHFKVTYEFSRDGVAWKEGDSLIFTRE